MTDDANAKHKRENAESQKPKKHTEEKMATENTVPKI
jgi:hypothetical protein